MLFIFVAFFSIILLLIIHEFGHFIIAKKFGVKVEEFGIGYPPRLFGKRIGETLYSINLLPFGALVKISGADGDDATMEDSKRYSQKPIWQRSLILLAGAISFWLVAMVLLTLVFSLGVSQVISDEELGILTNPRVQVSAVALGSPAEIAGVKLGDTIKQFSMLNQPFPISKIKDVQDFAEANKGKEVILTVERDKELISLSLMPRLFPPEGEGPMGIGLVRTAEKSYSFFMAPIKGVEATFNLTLDVIKGWGQIFSSLFKTGKLPQGARLIGPIGVGALATQAAKVGLTYFLQFIAVISIYLALSNLLPIPALDGGRLLFLGIEKIKGKAISPKTEQKINGFFFGLLLLLMIWVTIQDISRLF